MEITVQIKSVYGRDLVYPVCQTANVFARIAGTETLTDTVVWYIKSLGYAVNVDNGPSRL